MTLQTHYGSGQEAAASGHLEALAVLGVWLELGVEARGGLDLLLRALADERSHYKDDVVERALPQLPLDSLVPSVLALLSSFSYSLLLLVRYPASFSRNCTALELSRVCSLLYSMSHALTGQQFSKLLLSRTQSVQAACVASAQ